MIAITSIKLRPSAISQLNCCCWFWTKQLDWLTEIWSVEFFFVFSSDNSWDKSDLKSETSSVNLKWGEENKSNCKTWRTQSCWTHLWAGGAGLGQNVFLWKDFLFTEWKVTKYMFSGSGLLYTELTPEWSSWWPTDNNLHLISTKRNVRTRTTLINFLKAAWPLWVTRTWPDLEHFHWWSLEADCNEPFQGQSHLKRREEREKLWLRMYQGFSLPVSGWQLLSWHWWEPAQAAVAWSDWGLCWQFLYDWSNPINEVTSIRETGGRQAGHNIILFYKSSNLLYWSECL